jgi:ABC-type iron transport system FetAB permease component
MLNIPVEVYRRFGRTYYLHVQGKDKPSKKRTISRRLEAVCRLLLVGFLLDVLFDLEYGGSTFLRNVGRLLRNYTALYTRGQYSS